MMDSFVWVGSQDWCKNRSLRLLLADLPIRGAEITFSSMPGLHGAHPTALSQRKSWRYNIVTVAVHAFAMSRRGFC